MSIIRVSSSAGLLAAVKGAKGGDTISLASGNYGNVSFSYINPSSNITITAATGAQVKFDSLKMTSSSNMTYSDLEVGHTLVAGEPNSIPYVTVNKSSGINFVKLDIHGSLDGYAGNDGYGIRVTSSRDITIADSDFHQLNRAATFSDTDDIVVARNSVTETREGFGFGHVNDVVIAKNLFEGLTPIAGDHPDAIQFLSAGNGGSSHILIRNNVMLNDDDLVQGIYIQSNFAQDRFSDVLIENNLYFGGSRHGITASQVDGLTIADNSVIASPTPNIVPSINVNRSTGVKVADNITSLFIYDGVNVGAVPDNTIAYSAKSTGGAFLSALFASPPTTVDAALSNFVLKTTGVAALAGDGFDNVVDIGGTNITNVATLNTYYDSLHTFATSSTVFSQMF